MLLVALLLPSPPPAYAQGQVVVVEGDYLGEHGLPNQAKSRQCFQHVVALLQAARVPYVVTRDSQVEREGLPPATVAIFPYNRAMTSREADRVLRFMDAGGKVVVFFVAHEAILRSMGVRRVALHSTAQADPLTSISTLTAIPGMPEEVSWHTDTLAQAEALPGARPIAVWQGKIATASAHPAITAHDQGLFLSSSPLGLPLKAGGALLRGLIGLVHPEMWHAMLPMEASALGPCGRFKSLQQLGEYVEGRAQVHTGYDDALAIVRKATGYFPEIRHALDTHDVERALTLEQEARRTAESAALASYPSIPGELRGVWMHYSADPSWAVAARNLQDANFNAVFPYMMSGGTAYYASKVLPVHPKVKQKGDFLAEAIAATRAAGLPLHARMLNLTTLFATPEAREAMGKAGRLMLTADGKSSDWLCPTSPENRQVQVASALEMAAYGVAGIQFDYLRYPWKDTCFCKRCRQKFERDLGLSVKDWPAEALTGGYRGRFADWRREQLTSLVAEVSGALRKQYPGLMVSAAVFLNWEGHRESFGQDWVTWIERGLVDFVCPMNYTADMDKFQLYVSRQEKWIGGKAPWAAGLGVYADGCRYGGPEMALEQIEVARAHGSRGFVIFNYSSALATDYLPTLKQSVTRTPSAFEPIAR